MSILTFDTDTESRDSAARPRFFLHGGRALPLRLRIENSRKFSAYGDPYCYEAVPSAAT